MAPPSSFLTALVVLSCSSVCSLGCEPPHTHGLPHRGALTLLGHMRTLPAASCQKDRSDFAFPTDAFDGSRLQKAQALSVLHATNQKLFQLFCTEASASAAWNGALLDEFCAGLEQQLTHLEACLTRDAGARDAPLTNEESALRDYFQRISLYLREKKYSPCAWEIVRAEIMRSVYSSTALHRRLRSDK
ncbi:interferon alpha-like [Hyaena hyaena]|uniref:interferon alpha-like n=1 Tax=Hyaena hyaena TaxID=95912 RepID=UPI001920BADA|nr:interferon alpha-like [Hyaena hyaena]XP_039100348.1 interferon alpha-like [Hyaena hyaena]